MDIVSSAWRATPVSGHCGRALACPLSSDLGARVWGDWWLEWMMGASGCGAGAEAEASTGGACIRCTYWGCAGSMSICSTVSFCYFASLSCRSDERGRLNLGDKRIVGLWLLAPAAVQCELRFHSANPSFILLYNLYILFNIRMNCTILHINYIRS